MKERTGVVSFQGPHVNVCGHRLTIVCVAVNVCMFVHTESMYGVFGNGWWGHCCHTLYSCIRGILWSTKGFFSFSSSSELEDSFIMSEEEHIYEFNRDYEEKSSTDSKRSIPPISTFTKGTGNGTGKNSCSLCPSESVIFHLMKQYSGYAFFS